MKQIGICGTFDVESYGDLLFPILAEKELTARLGPLKLHRFSYFPKTLPGWPFEVTSLVELPKMIGDLDGLIIGGGDLIRFDKHAATRYQPPGQDIHHPAGCWLTPAMIALQNNVPVVWNAPGVCGHIPAWAEPLLKPAVDLSSYIAVRDEQSWKVLTGLGQNNDIEIMPDTAFGIGQILDAGSPSDEFIALRSTLGLTGPYIVVQATDGLDAFTDCVQRHVADFAGYQLVLVPAAPVLGDEVALWTRALPQARCLLTWPHALVMGELIAGAAAVVGKSLHLAITALACGVPVFRPAHSFQHKYAILSGFQTVHAFYDSCRFDPQWFVSKLGRKDPSPQVCITINRLVQHWDHVAAAFKDKRTAAVPETLGRIWQGMPILLEDWAGRYEGAKQDLSTERQKSEKQAAEHAAALADLEAVRIAGAAHERALSALTEQLIQLNQFLAQARMEIAQRDALVAERETELAQCATLQTLALEQQAASFNNLLVQARKDIIQHNQMTRSSEENPLRIVTRDR